jgi:hypothetical protein
MEEREKVMREAMETPWRAFTSAEQAEIIEKEKNFIFGQLGSYCTVSPFLQSLLAIEFIRYF